MLGHVEVWSAREVKLRVHFVPSDGFVLAHSLQLHKITLGDERCAGGSDRDGGGSNVAELEADTAVVLSPEVLDVDVDVLEDKPNPPKASARSDTLGTQASTSKRRSTLRPAKSWIKQVINLQFLLGNFERTYVMMRLHVGLRCL